MNREWDEIQQQQQLKMQEIQAETDRNLEAGRRSQQTRLLALKLTVDRIQERQPAAKSALVHFIDGYSKVNREMDKPEAMRSVQVVREGIAENEEGMKQLRDLAITPLPLEDRTTMLVCYGESKPGARDRELKSPVNSLWHARWRFEKRYFCALSDSHGTAGIWIVPKYTSKDVVIPPNERGEIFGRNTKNAGNGLHFPDIGTASIA